jgi:hypothetical protein
VLQIEPDERSWHRAQRALDGEADGQEFRRDLAEGLTEALRPAVAELRGAILGMASAGLPHAGESLRGAVAAHIEVEVRASGAVIRATKRGMPRGFSNAPKRLNARRGWRRQVYGGAWVRQIGKPGWFDDTTARGHERYRRAAEAALEKRIRRITRGS